MIHVANKQDKRLHCRHCCNDGFVLVGYSNAGTEQMAPCPMCEVGLECEFGDQARDPKAPPPVTPHKTWVTDGYWQGRSIQGLEVTCTCNDAPAFDNKERMRELSHRFGIGDGMPA